MKNSTIKQKTGICPECGNGKVVPVVAGRCASHYWQHRASVKSGKENGTNAKRQRIAPVSANRLEALKKYRRLRDKFLKEHPVCMFPGCNSREVQLHHKRTREYYLCDVSVFMSVCLNHHQWIHNNDSKAREMGFLLQSI